MHRITLPGTAVSVPRFLFGTASLFSVGRAPARQRLLDAAYDHGLTHFDTAPLYGFGSAERDLAPLLRRRPDATVTTKVGLHSAGGERQPDWMVLARKAGGRLLPALSRPVVDFGLARAKAALDASLGRLGRDRIDLYMLHEPEAGLFDADEWQRWLEDEVARGRVGAFGLAAAADRLPPLLAAAPGLATVVQTTDSLQAREADVLTAAGRPLQITYGYVSHAARAGGPVDVLAVLAAALRRNPDGAIIVSTSRPERLGQYQRLADAAA